MSTNNSDSKKTETGGDIPVSKVRTMDASNTEIRNQQWYRSSWMTRPSAKSEQEPQEVQEQERPFRGRTERRKSVLQRLGDWWWMMQK